jgi:rRNA maturation RNase YbeY
MINGSVQFFYPDGSFNFRNRNRLKAFISQLIKKEKQQLSSLNIIFVSDAHLLRINQEYLSHNYYTDIITFPLHQPGAPIEAELYISLDRVKANASDLGVSFQQELHRVIFHGILHLCGFNDKSSQQIKRMREREDHYLRLYFGR